MASEIIIIKPDEAAIQAEYSPVVARAEALTVTDQDEHEAASVCLKDLRLARKAVKDRLDPIIGDANRAHKAMTSLRRDLLKPLDVADRIVNGKLDVYEKEQKRIAAEAQRVAEAAARKIEEDRLLEEAIQAETRGDAAEADAILEEPIEAPVV